MEKIKKLIFVFPIQIPCYKKRRIKEKIKKLTNPNTVLKKEEDETENKKT